MRQWRNMFQNNEQNKTTKEQLSEVEIGNLPEKIQSNDDPRTWKKNGDTDRDEANIAYRRTRRFKEQRDEQYNNYSEK